jgi:hypothetical protein
MMKPVSPWATPSSMIRPLRLGRYSAAIVATNCRSTIKHAVEQDVDDLLGLERPTDPHGVQAGHREAAQDADHLGQGESEAIGVGLEDRTHEALTLLKDFRVDEVSRVPEALLVGLEGHHDPVDPAEHPLEDVDDGDQPLF